MSCSPPQKTLGKQGMVLRVPRKPTCIVSASSSLFPSSRFLRVKASKAGNPKYENIYFRTDQYVRISLGEQPIQIYMRRRKSNFCPVRTDGPYGNHRTDGRIRKLNRLASSEQQTLFCSFCSSTTPTSILLLIPEIFSMAF